MNAKKIIRTNDAGCSEIIWEVPDADFHKMLRVKENARKKIQKYKGRLDALKHHYRQRINEKLKEVDILIEKLTK